MKICVCIRFVTWPWDIVRRMSRIRLTLVALGTAVYAGLAVFGWGGFRAFFSHPALATLVIALFAMSGVALFAGGNLSACGRIVRTAGSLKCSL
jgi:hypothetical protein